LQRRPPSAVLDLFSDFRDGSKLLDLLEVMSGERIVSSPPEKHQTQPPPSTRQPTDRLSAVCLFVCLQSREKGRGMFQHRSNIEKALSFLKKKSVSQTDANENSTIDGGGGGSPLKLRSHPKRCTLLLE